MLLLSVALEAVLYLVCDVINDVYTYRKRKTWKCDMVG